mgnify:CR=1 FL=1
MPKKQTPRQYDQNSLFERETRAVFTDLSQREILNGRLLENVAIGTTSTKVSHGLGRVPKGWVVVDRTTDTRVFRDSTGTERATYLTLKASTAATVSLWVF